MQGFKYTHHVVKASNRAQFFNKVRTELWVKDLYREKGFSIFMERVKNPKLFEEWIDSGWAIVYEGHPSFAFKLIKTTHPRLNKLLLGKLDLKEYFLAEEDYDSIMVDGKNVIEFLDYRQLPCVQTKKGLSKTEFLEDPFYLAIFSNNIEDMKKYFDSYSDFKRKPDAKGLKLWPLIITENTISQWRPLIVSIGYNGSDVSAYDSLDNYGRFLLLKGLSRG